MNQPPTHAPIFDRLTALADATRCRMLLLVERHELTVSEICLVLQMPQSTVSRHLKTLADAGWVSSRRDGTSRLYTLTGGGEMAQERRLWLLVREQIADLAVIDQDGKRLASVLSARQAKSDRFFASAAGQWDHLRGELFGASFDLHALLCLLGSDWVVGDLGCGTGPIAAQLAPHVGHVIAVDGSPEMLGAARARLSTHSNVTLRRSGLETLAIDDSCLDVAILALVLHYVTSPPAVLAEAARTLKPSGKLLIVDMLPHDREEYRREMGHVWLGFPEETLQKMLRTVGFEETRLFALPSDPLAKGPGLFATVSVRTSSDTLQGSGSLKTTSRNSDGIQGRGRRD